MPAQIALFIKHRFWSHTSCVLVCICLHPTCLSDIKIYDVEFYCLHSIQPVSQPQNNVIDCDPTPFTQVLCMKKTSPSMLFLMSRVTDGHGFLVKQIVPCCRRTGSCTLYHALWPPANPWIDAKHHASNKLYLNEITFYACDIDSNRVINNSVCFV